MKNIIISGGAGYLGTFLTQKLLKKNNIIVFDTLYFPWLSKNKNKLKFNKRLKLIKKNINLATINDFKDIDIVIDLNGISNDPSSALDPHYTWKVNNIYRKNFASLARKAGVKRYIFNSTCSIYGYSKEKKFEKGKKNPISTYAKANFEAEKFLIRCD